jgi:hypothetical protein
MTSLNALVRTCRSGSGLAADAVTRPAGPISPAA